ncbi:MAG: ABC transporter ATP-binding protein [Bryobacterales bacterium]|nr:ABC transporter ATP-binding protein [Bryobacterales bacterium]
MTNRERDYRLLASATAGLRIDPPVVRAERLTKTHRSGGGHEVTVFAGLDCRIEPGERVAIVGASGAGKSSLLHLLGGLDRPTSGAVFYGDQDLFAQPDAQLAAFRSRHAAFVWQMNSLLPEFSAEENVLMPLLIRGVSHAEASRRAADALSQVGLSARRTHKPGELSGGEQQRVALARALVGCPSVLLADEPTGNLDFETADAVAGLLADLARDRGFTTIIVTHNQAFAATCDRVLQLEKGGFR